MAERLIFDCNDAIAIAYPGHGRAAQGKIHIAPIPRAGVAHNIGVYVEGEIALLQLRKAIDHALRIESQRGGAKVSKPYEEGNVELGSPLAQTLS